MTKAPAKVYAIKIPGQPFLKLIRGRAAAIRAAERYHGTITNLEAINHKESK